MRSVIDVWHHTVSEAAPVTVLPDGCRDVIVRQRVGQRPDWFVSHLQDAPMLASQPSGTQLTGYRLRAGVRLDLTGALPSDVDAVLDWLQDAGADAPNVVEDLEVLATASSVTEAAREIGVSARSLQRHVAAATGRTPVFWHRLGRMRRAGVGLSGAEDLAELAAQHGFADQAHFTRECRHWFGMSPHKLRADHSVLAQLAQPGLATGEQISTR